MFFHHFFGTSGRSGSDNSGSRRLTRQQRRRLERRQLARSGKNPASLAGESLESRALLAGVVADYTQLAFWGGGAQGGISLENQDATAVENWTATFHYGGTIASIWDAEIVS